MDSPEFFDDGPEEREEESRSPPSDVKRKLSTIGRRLAAVASSVGGAIARSAEAAAEVLTDAELRRRGAQVIADNASKAAKGIQHGLQTGASSIQRGLQTVQQGPKQIQAILLRVQHQIEQQRMAALLEEQRDALVDVQVGEQCYEDSPQELRSRLWTALLEHPELVAEYQALLMAQAQRNASCPPATPQGAPSPEGPPQAGWAGGGESPAAEPMGGGSGDASERGPTAEEADGAAAAVDSPGGATLGEVAGEAAGGGAEPQGGDAAEQPWGEEERGAGAVGQTTAAEPVEAAGQQAAGAGAGAGAAGEAAEPSEQDGGHLHMDAGHLSPSASCCSSRATSPAGRLGGPAGAAAGSSSRRGSADRGSHSGASGGAAQLSPPYGGSGAPASPRSSASANSEGWEVLDEGAAAGKRRQGQALLAGGGSGGGLGGKEGYSREQEAFRNKLMEAMMAVPWPLPTEYPEECRYSTLLQISVGQEEVDEVISRDIHRTFPEYPLFGFEQGQQALFRVLKAYSLHDIEVGYCQGMAFVAGLLLFYMNEEPAFQMFCRLLGASGPNLRRLYLPGLEGLKAELRRFEFLMGRYLPNLKAHLEAYGVVPVLFASQWFLTAFSCPFPVHFACRLLDVMAVEGTDTIMLRTALAIMAECEADLFMLDDFEEIITYLKVEPVQWPLHRVRRVLHAAVHSAITQLDLAAAAVAVDEGYAGSLSRHTSSLEAEPPGGQFFPASEAGEASKAAAAAAEAEATGAGAGPSTATAAERALSLRHHHSRGPSLGHVAATVAGGEGLPAAAGTEAGVGALVAGPGPAAGDALEAELAKQKAELDEEYMAMVLALDMMWAGDSGDAEAYEAALTSTPASAPRPPGGQQ